jgi:endonuclease G, mitochondrial
MPAKIAIVGTLIILVMLVVLVLVGLTVEGEPTGTSTVPSTSRHLALGNPSGATPSISQPTNYLIVRDQYALAYHRDHGTPNWVSWHLEARDLGSAQRYAGSFIPDTSLPDGWYQVRHGDYSGSGYDRGHMTPSADRTASEVDNQATFILSNIVPQAPANNQGLWAQLEEHARALMREGNELYIISGGSGSLGTLAGGRLNIPAHVWKVILVLPAGGGDDAARITSATEVIAIWTPNDDSVEGRAWQDFQTTAGCIEERTGLDFFAVVDDTVEQIIEGAGCDGAAGGQPSSGGAAPQGPPIFAGCAIDPGPAGAPERPVRIVAVDKIAETVTLQNVSAAAVSLDAWTMCSIRGGQQHPLGGALAAGATRTFPGPSENIWSNSSADPGALYDSAGRLVSYWPD